MLLGSGTSVCLTPSDISATPCPGDGAGRRCTPSGDFFIQEYAQACNEQFAVPLSEGDVAKTARSVSKFCWANPSFGRPVDLGRWDSDVQRGRSRLGVLARRRKVVDRNRVILAMHEDGVGIRAIGREIDLSPAQVSRVVRDSGVA